MNVDISVIVPIYNEKNTLFLLLDKLFASLKKSGLIYQVIAVDDGSSDGSVELLQEYKSKINDDERFDIILYEKNQGKGAAIHTGLKEVVGEYTVIQDADLEYEPDDIIRLYKYAKAEKLSVVYGSRNMGKNQRGTFFFYWGGKLVTYVANFLFGQKMTDEATCYKLIDTKRLQAMPLREKGFAFCPEVTSYIAKDGIKIQEIPIFYNPRSKDEGKKINWRDGLEAIYTLFRLRFPNAVLVLLLFLFTSLLYLTTWHMNFVGYEGETVTSALKLFNGEFDIRRAGISASILYLPFIALFHLFGFGSNINFLTIVPIFYSALSVVFLFYIVYYLTQKKYTALFLSFVIATGSVIWPYANIGMEYQMTFYLSLLLLTLLRWKNNKTSLWLVAIVFALLVTAKSYAVILGLPVLLFVWLVNKNKKKRTLKNYLKDFIILFTPALLSIITMSLLQYFSRGSFAGVYSLSHEFQVWSWWEGFYGIFFSAGKSIFLFSPLLILTLFVWKKFWQDHRETAVFLLVSFLLILLITAPFSYWTDETWSVRKLVSIIILLHLPLVSFFDKKIISLSKKLLFLVVFVLSVYIQILGSSYFYGKQLDILYEANVDSLASMRFIPQLGQISIYNNLFISYISNAKAELEYSETTWFRWIRDEADIDLHDVKLDISKYQNPDIVWFQNEGVSRVNIFYVLFISDVLLSLFIFRQYLFLKKKDE